MLEGFIKGARPFSIYAGAVAVALGVFCPTVPTEKLLVALTMAGAVAGLRSLDKKHRVASAT